METVKASWPTRANLSDIQFAICPSSKQAMDLSNVSKKIIRKNSVSTVSFIAKNENGKLLIMEMRLLFKHHPQIRWVSLFTVYAMLLGVNVFAIECIHFQAKGLMSQNNPSNVRFNSRFC